MNTGFKVRNADPAKVDALAKGAKVKKDGRIQVPYRFSVQQVALIEEVFALSTFKTRQAMIEGVLFPALEQLKAKLQDKG